MKKIKKLKMKEVDDSAVEIINKDTLNQMLNHPKNDNSYKWEIPTSQPMPTIPESEEALSGYEKWAENRIESYMIWGDETIEKKRRDALNNADNPAAEINVSGVSADQVYLSSDNYYKRKPRSNGYSAVLDSLMGSSFGMVTPGTLEPERVPSKVISLEEYESLVANQKPDDWREDTVLVNIETLADQFTGHILMLLGKEVSEDEKVDLRDEMYDLIFKNKV